MTIATNKIEISTGPSFFSTKGIIGKATTIFAALAAIMIGVTALIGIAGHNLGPFHALTALRPEGAGTLISVGLGIIVLNIVYGIKELQKSQRIYSENFKSFNCHIPRNGKGTYYSVRAMPCQSCSSVEKEAICSYPHNYELFMFTTGDQKMFTFNGTFEELQDTIEGDERFNKATQVACSMIIEGINWDTIKIEDFSTSEQRLTKELKIEIAKELKKLEESQTKGQSIRIDRDDFSYIVQSSPRRLMIYNNIGRTIRSLLGEFLLL